MKIRYRLMLGVIALSIGLCLMTYQSYALWTVTKESGESIVSVGCFEFSYEEVAGSNINLTNAYPMSDAKGLALTPYQPSGAVCGGNLSRGSQYPHRPV